MINDVDTPNWICDVLFVLIKNEKVIYFHNAENKNPTIFLYRSHCLITGRLFGLPTKGFGLEKHIYLAIKATAKSQIIKYLHAVQRKMKTLQFMSEFSTNISYQSYISRVLYSYPLFYHEPNKKKAFSFIAQYYRQYFVFMSKNATRYEQFPDRDQDRREIFHCD